MVGVRDDLAEALETLMALERIRETEDGREAAEAFALAVADNEGDFDRAIDAMLADAESLELLATFGEAWIEAEQDLWGPPRPLIAPPTSSRANEREGVEYRPPPSEPIPSEPMPGPSSGAGAKP